MNRIKKCREKAGFSQKYVAMSLGVSSPSVSEWEKGTTNPNISNLMAMADLFGVSTDELLGRDTRIRAAANLELTHAEYQLLMQFRALSRQGQEYILQTMDMAEKIYGGQDSLPSVETAD